MREYRFALVDSLGEITARVTRHADRRWILGAMDVDFASDGTVGLLDTAHTEGPAVVTAFSADGEPSWTRHLTGITSPRVGWNGEWFLAPHGHDAVLLVKRTGPALRFEPRPGEWGTLLGFSPDETETWWLGYEPLVLHRFALPD